MSIHKITGILLLLILVSCEQTEDYKSARKAVVDHHDMVMVDSELAFKNKIRLDTLASRLDSIKKKHPDADTLKEKAQINQLRHQLTQAEDQMNIWMHQFNAELGDKSNEEAVAYFKAEKTKVDSMDKLFKRLLNQSDRYLKKFEAKTRKDPD